MKLFHVHVMFFLVIVLCLLVKAEKSGARNYAHAQSKKMGVASQSPSTCL